MGSHSGFDGWRNSGGILGEFHGREGGREVG